MTRTLPKWERYERLIAELVARQVPTEFAVTPNAHLIGRLSGRSRQIDVLIDLRHNTDNSRRVIVDAKMKRRKITVVDVEAFRGLMEDVAATHGYLVCPEGYTKSAERRAQYCVSIRLVGLDQLNDFDPTTWPHCGASECANGLIFWDGFPEISIRIRPMSILVGLRHTLVKFVHYVGKCDKCHCFHVKCVSCGDVLPIPHDDDDDYGHQCSCKLPWFWLASIEEDGQGAASAELHAVFINDGRVITADRRALS